MPAAGGGNTRKRQRRRKSAGQYTPGSATPVSYPRPQRPRPRPRAAPRPRSGPFGGFPTQRPFAPAQRKAAARTRRAQSRLPARPVPHIPVIRNPTPQQSRAVRKAVVRTVNQAIGPGGSNRQRQQRRQAVVRELAASPSGRRFLKAGSYYARQEQLAYQGSPLQARNLRDRVGRGPADRRIGPGFASINTTSLGRALLGATSLNTPSAENRFFKAGAGDLKALGSAPFIGGYEAGRGAYEAVAHGDTQRLERLGKGLWEGVSQSVPGRLVSGDIEGAGKSFREHPLFALLDTAAGLGVVGRGAGAVARHGTGYKVGSTVRSPVALSNDAGAVRAGAYAEREASHDLFRSTIQKSNDSRREPLRDSRGKVVTVEQRGKQVPVLKSTQSEQTRWAKREGDFRSGRANAKERVDREVAARDVKVRGLKGQKARDLVAMVVEGTVPGLRHTDRGTGHVMTGPAAFSRYLADHAKRLDAERARRLKADPVGYRHSGELALNERRAEVARQAANDPKILRQAERIVAEGERIGRDLNAKEARAKALGVLSDEARARRSGLIPSAIEHLGGRHHTVEEHGKLEREALAAEKRAEEALLGVRHDKGGAPGGGERRQLGRLPTGARKLALQREHAAARAHRIAVSGRDPKGVLAHEKARDTAKAARATEHNARTKIARLEAKRQRLVGTQSSRRGRRMAEGEAKATKEERGKLADIDAELKAARATAHAAAKEARKAEHELKRTPMPKINAGVRTAEGKHLPDSEVERFLRGTGRDPESVAYLPHVPPGNSAYHAQTRPGTRPVIDKTGPQGSRTGEAYRKGATEASADLIRQQGVKLAVQINKAEQLDALVRERGLKHPEFQQIEAKAAKGEALSTREKRLLDKGGYLTGREAEEFAQRIEFDTTTGRDVLVSKNGDRYVPMRAFADRLSDETKRVIREDLQGPAGMESLQARLLNDRVIPAGQLRSEGARNVVLVNADLVKRMEDHLRPAGEIERMVQMINRPFRFAVLAQPRWLVGNFVEPYLVRLPGVGTGAVNVPGLLNDIRIAQKTLKTMERSGNPATRRAAAEVRAQHLGGLFIGGRGASQRRAFEDSKAYAAMVSKLPATRQMAEFAHKVGQALIAPGRGYFWVNREAIEKWAQEASLGRSIRRDVTEYFGSMHKAVRFGEEAAQEAARGLVNTPTQLRFLKEQQKLLGQYGDFSPRLRRAVQGPMPFLPWSLNAARFVYWTMPAHHTILTSLLVKSQQVFAEEWKQQHADLPPDLQETALGFDARRKDGGFTPGIRYTPYGLTAPASEGNLEGLDQALPAFGGPINALARGQDPFGNPLKTTPSADNPQGNVRGLLPKLAVAGNQLAEALIPYLSQARRLREGGETPYPTSNIVSPKTKPDTSHGMSAARRTFDPFRPTYVKSGGGAGSVKPLSSKAARGLGLDHRDLDELRKAASGAGAGLDKADLEELRRLARGGG